MNDRRQKRFRRSDRSSSSEREDDRKKKARLPSKVPASRVVHIRNISSGVDETDVIQLGLPFGKVSNILMLKQKNQAFLEFERESSAKTMVNYFENSTQPMICGRTVFVQFSQHRELKTDASHSNANAKTQAALKAARTLLDSRGSNKSEYSEDDRSGRILHLTVENLVYPVTLKTLALIFKKYGQLEKILTFTKNNLFQALIQYERPRDTEEARYALHGQNVYNGCCNLQIHRSKTSFIDVKFNDDVGWDFTKPSLPSCDDRRFPHESRSEAHGDRLGGQRSAVRFEEDSRMRGPPDRESHVLLHFQAERDMDDGYSDQSNRMKKPDRPLYHPPKGKFHENLATDFHKPSSTQLLRGILKGQASRSKSLTTARFVDEPEGIKGSVLLVSNLEETKTTPDKLFTLFGVYGDVVRVKILYNKKDTALIQFAEAQMADVARQHLDKVTVAGKVVSVRSSKHARVSMPKDDGVSENSGLTKDYSNSPLHRYKKAGSKNCGNIFKPSSTLHLSNIAEGVTEDDLVRPFKPYGEVVRFKFFAGTQKMAVLAMASTEEAIDALIHMHNHPFNKHHLRVSFSKSPLKT